MKSTFSGYNLKKSAEFIAARALRKRFSHFLWFVSCVGVLSVVSRCSLGVLRQGIRKGKEMAILTNSTFCDLAFFGSS